MKTLGMIGSVGPESIIDCYRERKSDGGYTALEMLILGNETRS